jgi:quercetin dioxygenase-like cupin family protein
VRRMLQLLSIATLSLLGFGAFPAQPPAVAQEAATEEIAFEPLSLAVDVDLPSAADVLVTRVTLGPGTRSASNANDPTVAVLLVESGTFTIEIDAPLTVTRAATFSEALAAAENSGDFSGVAETIAPGEEVTLQAGDVAYIPANMRGEIRNDGQIPAVALGFLAAPTMLTDEDPPAS